MQILTDDRAPDGRIEREKIGRKPTMTSRERVLAAINHQQPDRVPIDFGATGQTGISVCALYRLREYLGLPKRIWMSLKWCRC